MRKNKQVNKSRTWTMHEIWNLLTVYDKDNVWYDIRRRAEAISDIIKDEQVDIECIYNLYKEL